MEKDTKDFSQHIGHKIERIRRMRGMNQDTLAEALQISRQTLSKIEQSETLEAEKLDMIAKALGVTSDTIRNFKEDAPINFTQYNYEGAFKDGSNIFGNTNCTINPIEKITELYEALLKSEREKTEIYKQLLASGNRSA